MGFLGRGRPRGGTPDKPRAAKEEDVKACEPANDDASAVADAGPPAVVVGGEEDPAAPSTPECAAELPASEIGSDAAPDVALTASERRRAQRKARLAARQERAQQKRQQRRQRVRSPAGRSSGGDRAAAAASGWRGRLQSAFWCFVPPRERVAAGTQQQQQQQEDVHEHEQVQQKAKAVAAAPRQPRGCLALPRAASSRRRAAAGQRQQQQAASAQQQQQQQQQQPPVIFSPGMPSSNPITSVTTAAPPPPVVPLQTWAPPAPPRVYTQAVIGAKRPEDFHKKTLVLDLDETLVHSSFKPVPNPDYIIPVEIDGRLVDVYVLKRPWLDHFMATVGPRFEVVVFTASLAKYADPLLDLMDTTGCVRWRLFREACCPFEGNYVKDLLALGRPLSSTIIVDNSPHSYIFQPDNAVPITTFIDNMEDQELLEILPQLLKLETVEDVRAVLGPQNVANYHLPPASPPACASPTCEYESSSAAAPPPLALAPLGVRC